MKVEPHLTQRVKRGKTAKLFCDGHFENEMEWSFNTGPLPKRAFFIGDDNYDTLYIGRVTREHQGFYECVGHYNRPPHYPTFAAKSFVQVVGNHF